MLALLGNMLALLGLAPGGLSIVKGNCLVIKALSLATPKDLPTDTYGEPSLTHDDQIPGKENPDCISYVPVLFCNCPLSHTLLRKKQFFVYAVVI